MPAKRCDRSRASIETDNRRLHISGQRKEQNATQSGGLKRPGRRRGNINCLIPGERSAGHLGKGFPGNIWRRNPKDSSRETGASSQRRGEALLFLLPKDRTYVTSGAIISSSGDNLETWSAVKCPPTGCGLISSISRHRFHHFCQSPKPRQIFL
jgi:hypothetical protein